MTPEVIKNQQHFLEDSISAFGDALHPLVAEVHHDPSNEVRFVSREETRKRKRSGSYDFTENSLHTEDARDGRSLLKHISANFRHYDSVLNNRDPVQMKSHVNYIRGRIIRRRPNHSLTWDCLLDTVTHMFSFIEKIVDCLRPVNAGLASIVSEGLNSLNDITMNANCARRLSQQLNN